MAACPFVMGDAHKIVVDFFLMIVSSFARKQSHVHARDTASGIVSVHLDCCTRPWIMHHVRRGGGHSQRGSRC